MLNLAANNVNLKGRLRVCRTIPVLRDGELKTIPLKEVVLDDVMTLRIGDQVPANVALLSSEGLEVYESLLTGEAESIVKNDNDNVLSGSA